MLDEAAANIPSADEAAAMREYMRFYDSQRASILAHTFSTALRGPEFARILSMLSPEMRAEGYALQMRAIFDNEWEPYLAHLQKWGEWYANEGVSYSAWLDFVRAHRDTVTDELAAMLAADPKTLDRVKAITRGINALSDLTVEWIGKAYLKALVARPEERYRALFEHSPVPMWMFDRDTLQFVMVNDAAVARYGYSKDEFATMTLADIRPPEDVAEMRADVAHSAGLLTDHRVWRHRTKDGTIRSVEIRANDFVSQGKNVRLAVIDDVTDRLEAERALRDTEAQLRHAQKMEAVGRLAGSVAHDFNNVLTVVQSYATLLEESAELPASRREDAAEIRRAAERAAAITRQLLALNRQSIAAPRSISLVTVVDGFLPMLQRLVGEGVAIATRCARVPDVVADPGQVEQVLMNLAVNARDAMVDGGRLTIATQLLVLDVEAASALRLAPGRYVELAITDTGTGIDAETQQRIFDPFFTTKEVGKGTGLGLSIAHGIVTQAGGSITVDSQLGHGSTFRVHLPVADRAIVAAADSQIAAPNTLPALRVLVIDAQRDVRAVAARVLRDAGCQTFEAATGDEARRICVREQRLDLVLVDVVLPDMRGELLLDELRDLRPALRFVQMSGYPTGGRTPRPDNLLTKPFSPAELRGAVARAIEAT